jgi:FixJ family two-component response regulator
MKKGTTHVDNQQCNWSTMTLNATVSDAAVYVVDDDVSVRKAVTRMFKSLGFQVASFGTAREFLEYQRADVPGCLILDVQMPGQTGIELQEKLVEHDVDLPIVFMTAHGDIPMTVKAMQSGAVDFLPKPVDEQQLVRTVQQAIERHVIERQEKAAEHEFRRLVATLSKREYEVMTLVIGGMLNKQIARRLGITEYTVKVHRGRVMEKTGVNSVAELVRLCERSGIAAQNQ